MGEKQRLSKHSLLKLGCGGCVHLYIADGVEPNCWINSGRGIPKPCLDRLNFDEARSLKAELQEASENLEASVNLVAKWSALFKKIETERDALKEQVEAYKRGAELQAGIDWHEAFVDAESRIAEAEKLPEAIARVLNIRFGIGSWENIEFDCSAFDACDSINAVGDIATILRTSWPEKSLRGKRGDEK